MVAIATYTHQGISAIRLIQPQSLSVSGVTIVISESGDKLSLSSGFLEKVLSNEGPSHPMRRNYLFQTAFAIILHVKTNNLTFDQDCQDLFRQKMAISIEIWHQYPAADHYQPCTLIKLLILRSAIIQRYSNYFRTFLWRCWWKALSKIYMLW